MNEQNECRIEYTSRLNDDMLQSLHMLYAPMMASDAIHLYETMYAIAISAQPIKNHTLILKCTHLSFERFQKLRMDLECFQLLKTYRHTNQQSLLYVLMPPKTGLAFLQDEIFGRMYYKVCGKQMYEFMKLAFQPQKTSIQDYEHISAPMKLSFVSEWKDEDETTFDQIHVQESEDVDQNFIKFLNDLSTLLFPMSARTPRNLKFIAKWSAIYGLNEMQVKRYISRAVDTKLGVFKQDVFLALARGTQGNIQIDTEKDSYDCSPVEFLRRRQQGIDLSLSDKKIIEMLIEHYRLPNDVINIMVEYVLDKNNQNLNKNYVEKVASSWVRLKIDTKEKALEHIRNGKAKPKEDWLDRMQRQNNEGQDDPEETRRLQEELAKMMAQIGGNES